MNFKIVVICNTFFNFKHVKMNLLDTRTMRFIGWRTAESLAKKNHSLSIENAEISSQGFCFLQ